MTNGGRPKFPHEPNWHLSEIIADDMVSSLAGDGLIYITFSTRRSEAAPSGKPPEIKTVTSARLVLTISAAGKVLDYLNTLFAEMEKKGIVNREPETPRTLQ